MAAINQRIPNFLGGVSQQPDFIKFPGQLRSCDNAVPDVTFGLMKRPPAEYVNKLTNTTSTGQWFEIFNKEGEKFIVQITPASYASTPIRIWNLTTGVEVTVTEGTGDAYDYLNGAGTLGKHTIQDYTYITNPNKPVGTTGTTIAFNGGKKYAFVQIETLAYNTEYVIYVSADNTTSMPDPDTKYMATGITAYRNSGTDAAGNNVAGKSSWTHADPDSALSGQKDYDAGTLAAAQDLRATVIVNGQPFFKNQSKEFDGTGTESSDFLGYIQNYDIRYTVTATLRDGGTDCGTVGTVISNAVGIPDATGSSVGYDIEITGRKPYDTYRFKSNVAKYVTPKNPDKGSLSMANVLKGLVADLTTQYGNTTFTYEIIGNGILIKKVADVDDLHIELAGGLTGESLSYFKDSAQDVSKLPSECDHGYIVEVANTEESDADNYWLKFKADNGDHGTGVWEETVAPGITAGLDHHTMPHALVAVRDSNDNITSFKFCELSGGSSNPKGVEWDTREVGDLETNPDPSFVGKKISQIFFYRNRLGFIANEQVVLSQPSSYHNFFAVSAITTSDDNPIDISVSDVKPAYIHHVLPTQKGVMMFSDAGQFMLFSEQDAFSPKTARLKKLAGYECSPTIKPLDMGTTYMFVNHAGAYSRAFEMAIVDESIPPKIIDQTRVVPEFLPKTINVNSGSADLGLTTFGINNSTYDGTVGKRSTIYHYKYFDSGDQREQSAWYTWTLTGVLRHCFYTGGSFYTVTQQENNEYILSKYEYAAEEAIANKSMTSRSYTIGDAEAPAGQGYAGIRVNRNLEAALDNLVMYKQGDTNNTTAGVTVAYTGGNTIITVPYTWGSGFDPYIVVVSGTESGVVKEPNSKSGTTFTFNGIDMTSWHMAIGYQYTTQFELPQYYFAYDQGKYDIDGDLRMGGYNFELGVSGPIEFDVADVIGNSSFYEHTDSGMLTDWSTFQSIPQILYKSVRIPIYRKNNKFRFTVKINQPFSATIVSASWDGRYNTRRHVRK